MNKREVLKYFKNKNVFSAKDFDSACLLAHDFAKENGFSRDELELIADYSLSQKLSSRRISYMIKTLIPETYMSDKVIRDVLKYLMSKNCKKEATKAIFQWLIGLTEQKLTESDVIDRYYDFYYSYASEDDPLALKLVYLLTKPQDVKRWYVKKILHTHHKQSSRPSGALLYLFKTYRPDFVPENIPAYAAQTVFPKLPAYITEAFSAARERIHVLSEVAVDNDNICWERIDSYKRRQQNIVLIPRNLIVDDNFRINENDASLRKIRNLKQLHRYMLSNYSLGNTYLMQLLNNSAGRMILAFADNKIHTTISYMIYSILCEYLYNPKVHYEEMKYFLQCIASLQKELQQSIPIVSVALADYMVVWNGDDYFEEILSLLEFISFSSYNHLHECFLKPLHILFITSSLNKKCDILNALGNMILNFIMAYAPDYKELRPLMFSNEQPELDFIETIEKLLEFMMKLCQLGLYLEKSHCYMQYSILLICEKIISARVNIRWSIPDSILYSILFSYNPNNILHAFSVSKRSNCIPERVIQDYYSLLKENSTLRFLEDISKNEWNIIVSLKRPNYWNVIKHLSFSPYFIQFDLNKTKCHGLVKIMNFFNRVMSEEDEPQKKKKRKRLGG